MANGNGRPLTGDARIEINNQNIPAALQKASEQYRQREMERIIADPRLLVEQTPAWIEDCRAFHPEIKGKWETKILSYVNSIDAILLKHLTGVRGLENPIRTSLKFTGRGLIYASFCPRCGEACVRIQRVDVECFHPPSTTDRLLRNKKCDHMLPLPNGFWQLLLNIDFLTAADLSSAADPCPES